MAVRQVQPGGRSEHPEARQCCPRQHPPPFEQYPVVRWANRTLDFSYVPVLCAAGRPPPIVDAQGIELNYLDAL